jgi:predicted kinase
MMCREHLIETDHQLILPVGLPRSGKSTVMRAVSRIHGAPLVSPDEVRRVIHGTEFRREAESFVWGVVKTIVPALFEAGHSVVIVDACNVTRAARESWRCAQWRRVYANFMSVTRAECLRRAVCCRASRGLMDAIESMAERLEPVHEDECDD